MDIENKTLEILDLVREKVLSPDEALPHILRLFSVVGRSEQFNCLGGNYAKGITECKEWCGEDMCQKPNN